VSADLYWLLDLEFAGQTLRLSTTELDVTSDDGVLHYEGGLEEVTLSEAVELLDSQLTEASVSISAVLPVDVPTLIARGHRLEGATGTLALWREGQTYEQRRVRLVGRVQDPEYGSRYEPIDFTLADEVWQTDIETPPLGLEVTGATWPNSLQDTYFPWLLQPDLFSSLLPEDLSLPYPIVFGKPGRTSGLSSPAWEGSIAVHISRDRGSYTTGGVATQGPVIVIAGHRVKADSVYLYTESISNATWDYYKSGFPFGSPSDNGFVVEHWTDARGNVVAVVPGVERGDTTGSIAALVNGISVCTLGSDYMNNNLGGDDSYRDYSDGNGSKVYVPIYVGWYDRTRSDEGGGMVGDDGELVRGAGDVLTYLLRQTGMAVDAGKCAAAVSLLNDFKIDCAIDARVNIWEWLSANLLPLLPVSIATGPEGLYPVVWRYDARANEARWEIDVDADPTISRAGRVKIDSSKIANRFRIDFCRNRRTDEPMQYRGLDATYDPDEPSVRGSYLCAVSQARYRSSRDSGVREKEIDTSIIWDVATADAILAVQARAYALARRTVSYVVGGEQWDAIERGDIVTITDSEIGLEAQVALVREIQWDSSGSIGLSLLIIEDPARDKRSA
jgi:hypothetical protein